MTNYNPERCDWHEEKMRQADKRISRIENALYTTNGEPGLIEVVRGIARLQRWHTIALAVLVLLQLEAPLREALRLIVNALMR